jgi:hypothetical protein
MRRRPRSLAIVSLQYRTVLVVNFQCKVANNRAEPFSFVSPAPTNTTWPCDPVGYHIYYVKQRVFRPRTERRAAVENKVCPSSGGLRLDTLWMIEHSAASVAYMTRVVRVLPDPADDGIPAILVARGQALQS